MREPPPPPPPSRSSAPTEALAGSFILLGAVILASLVIAYQSGQRILELNAAAQEHHAHILTWKTVFSTLQDAETGQRGYLLTGDENYLEPHRRARQMLQPGSAELPGTRVTSLRSLLNAKLAELDRTVGLFRAGQAAEALAIVKSGEGKNLMDEIRREMGREVDEEETALQHDRREAAAATRARNWLFGGVALANLCFLPWAYRRISREQHARLAAQVEGQRQRELLAVTLTSIGDAVILTDTAAAISYMNAVAEELTGWKASDAVGRPCREIFQIIQEESRHEVESPVDKVLRDGRVVGLANHTLLIRRDGSEVPIDDSGAPVRDESGRCVGVVLVFRDFSDYKSAERSLRAAKADLEQASQAKDRFLAALSHELRTPLTPVLATPSQWEKAGAIPTSHQRELLMLRRNVEFEARLIDDLLDLTRITSGKLAFRKSVVDVHDVAQAAAAIVEAEIDAKGLAFRKEFRAPVSLVESDATRLQQVLLNLLQNSAKFTRTGEIALSTENDADGGVRLTVRDTGIGMEPELMAKLFRYFEQGSEKVAKRFGGLGVGLALSHSIVEGLGGRLEAHSGGEGCGSSFTVTLPPALAGMAPPAEVPGQALAGSARALRILLVEDHIDTLNVLQRLLGRSGHAVRGVSNIAAAIALLGEEPFDLLISDLGLPDGTGVDLIRRARTTFRQPAVALSGYGMEEDIRRCREAGFNAHLTKPINYSDLENLLPQVLGASEESWHGDGPATTRRH